MSNNSWDVLHKNAKLLESSIEHKLQEYAHLAQKINISYVGDEESSLISNDDENALSREIEHLLADLYECIQSMRQNSNGVGHGQQETWIKRYYEIHFDYSSEFKSISEAVQRKRDSYELLGKENTRKGPNGKDSDVSKLLKEKMSISSAMMSIHDVVGQAFEAKSALSNQRNMLSGSNSGVMSITSSMPSIGRMIESIQKKRSNETIVIAVVVGLLISFTIWWTMLR